MGLDMYLNKRTYIGAHYEHRNVKGEINITTDDKPVKINFNRVSSIEERVGYWRKANQIHKWFVDNVQDGKDDCGEYSVGEEDLQKLLHACKAVKENQLVASEVLPVKSGFFFGSVEYDEFYMKDIDDTIEIIESLLSERNEKGFIDGDIYYSSSW